MKRRIFQGKIGLLLLLLFVLAGSVLLISFIFSLFDIKTIVVEPKKHCCSHRQTSNSFKFITVSRKKNTG